MDKRPTIEELEAILEGPDVNVRIMPDGSITTDHWFIGATNQGQEIWLDFNGHAVFDPDEKKQKHLQRAYFEIGNPIKGVMKLADTHQDKVDE